MADVAGFTARKAASEAKGKKRGLGYSCYIEACGIAPSNIAGALGARAGLFEAGEVRVHPTGTVTVFTGSHSHGQGHETTFAQVVAGKLGIPVDNVEIVHGDTGRVPFGMGTYGSRSLAVGGTAIVKAVDKIIAKGKKIAAHLLEAADTDIEFENGEFKVAGTDKKVPWGSVSLTAYVPHNFPLDKLEPGLNENAFYDPTNFTYPSGSYVCEVEVDPDTGKVQDRVVRRGRRLRQHRQPDDRRRPGARRHRPGPRPGDDGRLRLRPEVGPAPDRLATWTTRCRAPSDLPSIKLATTNTPCSHNPLGVKGCGEAGAIGSPAGLHQRADRRPRRASTWRCRRRSSASGAPPSATTPERERNKENTMYAFDYQRPASRDAAKAAASGADARYLAGGQSLIQAMRLRLSQSERLVDLGGIADLKTIKVDASGVTIGAMATHAAVAAQRRRAARRFRRSPSSPAASATRWCATWARSAARSPMPTRRPAIRPRCSA